MKNTSMLALAAFASAFTLTASAQSGYATQGGTATIWMNPYGLCWHSGFWTEQDAVSPCDKPAQIAPVAAPATAIHSSRRIRPRQATRTLLNNWFALTTKVCSGSP